MKKRLMSIVLSLAMILSLLFSSATVYAADETETGSESAYVLMNIPYAEFYEGEGVEDVDAVSTATVKTYNQNMAAGSYHAGYEAADPISDAQILGITYPVYVEDTSVLEGLTEVTDESSATITVASGKSSTTEKEVQGKDLLFASGDYAYYVLAEEPANYKTLAGTAGSFSFSAVKNGAEDTEGMTASLTYGGHYTDIAFTVSAEEIGDEAVVSAIILGTADGGSYALRHVEDIWRKTSLGWNWDGLDGNGLAGKTITSVTYYLQDGSVLKYAVEVAVKLNGGEISAAFEDAMTVAVTGLPEDIENAAATVATKAGRGQTPVVVADGAAVADGKIILETAAEAGTTYTVKVTSDNYGDLSAEAEMPEAPELTDISEAVVTFTGIEKTRNQYWAAYDGAEKKPEVVVTLGDATLTADDYDVEYADNVKVGTATVTVTGKGSYTGIATGTFLITFKDVPATHSYQKAVYWAVDEGIAAGYSGDKEGTFGINDDITRGQVVLFLWRAAGNPKAKDLTSQSFSDVGKKSAFYKAIQWAVEEGIVGGYKDGTFRPSEKCTRGQIAMFLWRFDGRKAPQSSAQTFSDVPTSSKFYKAIQWAAENGITAGYKDGTFGINKSCTRGHCVTFLYRLLAD